MGQRTFATKKEYLKFAKETVQEQINQRKVLVRYLRNEENAAPYGVVVGLYENGQVKVGQSICHADKDKWNKYEGVLRAMKNATVEVSIPKRLNQSTGKYQSTVPDKYVADVTVGRRKMHDRAYRYFVMNRKGLVRELLHND